MTEAGRAERVSEAEALAHVRSLFEIYRHGVVFHFICALTRLGVFDAVEARGGELDIDVLANELALNRNALTRSLHLLAAHGLIRVSSGSVRLEGAGVLLTSSAEFSLMATFATPGVSDVGNQVEHTIRSGEQSFELARGEGFWSFLHRNPDREGLFHQAMREQSRLMGMPSVPLLDWPVEGTVVDLGGGSGSFLAAVLQQQPRLHGILLDRPAAVAAATERFELERLEGRASAQVGDLFVPPPPADLFVLSRVLHDWSDDEVRTILAGIRLSARAGVRLRILEELLDHDTPPSPEQAWSDAVMMVLYQGGHERTENDYRSLLTESGWRVVDVFTGLPGLSVLDAVAV
jgi:hypothetical protein